MKLPTTMFSAVIEEIDGVYYTEINGVNYKLAPIKQKRVKFNYDIAEHQFKEVWDNFVTWRVKEKGIKFKTQEAIQRLYLRIFHFANGDPEKFFLICKESMDNGYQGVFPLKNYSKEKVSTYEKIIRS